MLDYEPKIGTLPARVIALLRRHPDEALSNADIAQKFSDSASKLTPSAVDASLLAAVNAGVLKRSTDGYRLGSLSLPPPSSPSGLAWPPPRAAKAGAAAGSATDGARVNWQLLVPIVGVPIPPKRARGADSALLEFAKGMQVGSCTPPIERRRCMQAYQSIVKAAKRTGSAEWMRGREYSYRADGDGTARFWRVA